MILNGILYEGPGEKINIFSKMHKTHLKWWLRDLNNIFQNSKLNILYNVSPLALLEIILDIQFLIVTNFQTFYSTFKDKVSTSRWDRGWMNHGLEI